MAEILTNEIKEDEELVGQGTPQIQGAESYLRTADGTLVAAGYSGTAGSLSLTAGEDIAAGDSVFYQDGRHKVWVSNVSINDTETINGTNDWIAQTFTAPDLATTLDKVSFVMRKTGSFSGNYVLSIRATSSGLPTGSDLATSNIVNNDISTDTEYRKVNVSFNYTVTPGTTYALVLNPSGVTFGGETIFVRKYNTDIVSGARITSSDGSSWTSSTQDITFQARFLYGSSSSVYLTGEYMTPMPTRSGIAITSAGAGENVTVVFSGIVSGMTGLSTNTRYYQSLSTAGTLDSSATTGGPFVGRTMSDATKILLQDTNYYDDELGITSDYLNYVNEVSQGPYSSTDDQITWANLGIESTIPAKADGTLYFNAYFPNGETALAYISNEPFPCVKGTGSNFSEDGLLFYKTTDTSDKWFGLLSWNIQAGQYVYIYLPSTAAADYDQYYFKRINR